MPEPDHKLADERQERARVLVAADERSHSRRSPTSLRAIPAYFAQQSNSLQSPSADVLFRPRNCARNLQEQSAPRRKTSLPPDDHRLASHNWPEHSRCQLNIRKSFPKDLERNGRSWTRARGDRGP